MTDIEALAEVWASIEGELDAFRIGKTLQDNTCADYMLEAQELLRRLEMRGFTVTAIKDAPPAADVAC
ncbi:MAG: hypothetical protein Q8M07_10330 [Prosthecobacter sp.]|nr:hypothetical protein [Prosthecobacter sp.]